MNSAPRFRNEEKRDPVDLKNLISSSRSTPAVQKQVNKKRFFTAKTRSINHTVVDFSLFRRDQENGVQTKQEPGQRFMVSQT
jgi:hypothetical protein